MDSNLVFIWIVLLRPFLKKNYILVTHVLNIYNRNLNHSGGWEIDQAIRYHIREINKTLDSP